MRQLPAAFVLLLIAFTNFYFQGSGNGSEENAMGLDVKQRGTKQFQTAAVHAARRSTCDSKLIDAYRELFGSVPQQSLSLIAAKHHIQYVIATVPDPERTRLALEFDRLVEGIQAAADEAGYTFQSVPVNALPWKIHSGTDGSSQAKISVSRGRPGLTIIENVAPFSKCPGLLLFRKHQSATPSEAAEAESYLVLLLVGEKPTEGLNTDQFLNALAIIRRATAHQKRKLKPPRIIGILGPNFSGSYSSLDRLLTLPPHQHSCTSKARDNILLREYFVIRSGSTMSADQINWFRFRNGCHASLLSFFYPDGYEQRKLLSFLQTNGVNLQNVALLTEDETAYGSLPPESKPSPSNTGVGMLEPGLKVYFPRGIATLRTAYQEASLLAAPDASRGPRTTLKADFGANEEDEDTVPIFDLKHVPLSQEAVLQEIIRTLRLHRVNFVIIRATDVMDTLFLAAQLRKSYSQARLVALTPDLLARRDPDDSSLRGTLSVSNYPPFQGWVDEQPDGTSHTHRIFTDATQEGEFNATLELLMELEALRPNNPNELKRMLQSGGYDSSGPKSLSRDTYAGLTGPVLDGVSEDASHISNLPLWVSVIGRDGYWPLTVLGRKDGDERLCKSDLGGENGGYSCGPRTATLPSPKVRYRGIRLEIGDWSFSGAKAKAPDAFLLPGGHFSMLNWLPGWAPRTIKVPKVSVENVHVLNIMVGFFLSIITGVFIYLIWRGDISDPGSSVSEYLGPLVEPRIARLLLVGASLLMAGWSLILIGSRSVLIPWTILMVATLCNIWIRSKSLMNKAVLSLAGTAAVTYVLWWLARPEDAATRFIFLYRADNFVSGLSPTMPLLLLWAAALWWIWYALKASCSFDKRRPLLPRGHAVRMLPSHDRYGDAGSARTLLFTTRFYLVAGICVAILITQKLRLHSLEGTRFDIIFNVTLCLALILLLNSLYGAWVYWQRCRNLLIALNRTPLRYGFMAMKGFEWRRVWGLAGADSSFAYRPLVKTWQALQRLHENLQEPQTSYLKAMHDRLQMHADELRKHLEPTRKILGQAAEPPHSRTLFRSPRDYVRMWSGKARKQLEINQSFYRGIGAFQWHLSTLASMIYFCILQEYWSHDQRWVTRDPRKTAKPTTEGEKDNRVEAQDPTQPNATVQWAEEFLALLYISFVVRVLLRIRWLGMSAIGVYVFCLLAVTVYPFEPKATIHAFFVFVFLAMLGTFGIIYAQMHRDDTLSHLTDTDPGALGSDYWLRMVSFAGVPLFTLVTTQVPQLSRILFFWVKPLLDGISKS